MLEDAKRLYMSSSYEFMYSLLHLTRYSTRLSQKLASSKDSYGHTLT